MTAGGSYGLTAPKEYTSEKRYSEFVTFDTDLCARLQWLANHPLPPQDSKLGGAGEVYTGGFQPVDLPPKRLWPLRESVIQERKLGLRAYVAVGHSLPLLPLLPLLPVSMSVSLFSLLSSLLVLVCGRVSCPSITSAEFKLSNTD